MAGHDDDVANELAEMTGASVTLWHRTDCTEVPTIDIERLGRLVTAQSAQDLLVLVGGDEPRVIPFVTTGHDAGGA